MNLGFHSFLRGGLLTTLLLLQAPPVKSSHVQNVGDSKSPRAVHLCEILRSPEQYNGQTVTVHATYQSGYEANALYCLSCADKGEVWVTSDTTDDAEKGLKAMGRFRGPLITVNGDFTGIFNSEGSRYGHLGLYRYQIVLRSVRHLKLVDRLGRPPETLTPSSRKKVSQ